MESSNHDKNREKRKSLRVVKYKKIKKIKKLSLLIILIVSISFSVNAQKVVIVKITTTMNIEGALAECKEAGKKAKFGSRDYEANKLEGKVTLWITVGRITQADVYCEIKATHKGGITTLNFRMPKNLDVISLSWKKELKRITKHLNLPEMMVGEYFYGIE